MFLDETLHIFISYVALAAALFIPPFMGWWERLLGFLNRRELDGQMICRIFLILFPLFILSSVVITHIFQFMKGLGVDFWLFASASFVVIPFTAAYFGIAAFSKGGKGIGIGDLGVLLFFLGGFGAAGANIHDVLWCGRATELYTVFKPGGDDLKPWVDLFNPPSYDYRIFGFYMFIQVIIALTAAHIVYFRWMRMKKIKAASSPLIWSWSAMAFLASAITLIDWPHVVSPPSFHTSVIAVLIVFASIFFYRAGSTLNIVLAGSGESS